MMNVSTLPLLAFIFLTALVKSSYASNCQFDCEHAGFFVLCGSDGDYYMNLCQLKASACEKEINITVNRIGHDPHCSEHPWASWVETLSIFLHDFSSCLESDNFCQNYGVCAQQKSSFCLCPKGFEGERCENRADTKEPPTVALHKGHPRALVGSNTDDDNYTRVIMLFCLCALSAMMSSVITSAVCHRIRQVKMKRLRKEMVPKENWIYEQVGSGASDSKIDMNIFEQEAETRSNIVILSRNNYKNTNKAYDF